VPLATVQQTLRQTFRRWGLPDCLRVDNGVPWGSFNDLPTRFALWVVGLGVRWHWNAPRCPQQNPKVERSQGTGKRWAEPGSCRSVAELQGRLDEADRLQREEYRTRGGGSRLELFPQLRHSGRTYSLAWEERTWSLGVVEEHLAEYVAVRRVGSNGNVGVYDRVRYVGRQYAGCFVQVQYDPQAHGWLIADTEGRELRRHEAPEISRDRIVKMTLGKKQDSHSG
jgi:transposase InsO family protein